MRKSDRLKKQKDEIENREKRSELNAVLSATAKARKALEELRDVWIELDRNHSAKLVDAGIIIVEDQVGKYRLSEWEAGI